MAYDKATLTRGIVLGAISGLKVTYGPALLATSRRSEGWQALAMAAMGEMMLDKLPFLMDRSRASMLLPRTLAGFWAAKSSTESPGESRYDSESLGIALAGAVAAAGVAVISPKLRGMLRRNLGIPDTAIAVAEDALAIAAGSAVLGISPSDLKDAGQAALSQAREGKVGPAVGQLRKRVLPI